MGSVTCIPAIVFKGFVMLIMASFRFNIGDGMGMLNLFALSKLDFEHLGQGQFNRLKQ
jgi:hypothetical protein